MRLFAEISLKGIFNFLTNKNYREFIKLVLVYGNQPRYKPRKIKTLKYQLDVPDCLSFIWQFKEIFVDQNYLFTKKNKKAIIIDCGSNIGLSLLFFNKYFPDAEILGFEPNPTIFKSLKKNITSNNCQNIKIFDQAVWTNNDGIEIELDNADSSSIYGNNDNVVKVNSIRLLDVIKNYDSIDLLKMDIEGAEINVIKDCKDELARIENMFIEYHSFVNYKQELSLLLNILTETGFRYYVQSVFDKKSPMINKINKNFPNMDLQLNIYAFKNEDSTLK